MLTGPEKLVLQAVQELPKDQFGNVHDVAIATGTGLSLPEVGASLESLDQEGLVSNVRLADDHLAACITARGSLRISQGRPYGNGPAGRLPGPDHAKIVPKGLRSFDEGDRDFFLQLLPGPVRYGLPESIHFWKARIEAEDRDKTFRVGVIFGPSGCGKSSLVKAGLLPRLAKSVASVYVEATSDDTEVRLLKGLRRACPDLPGELGLVDAIDSLRVGRTSPAGRKVVLVIDQFEQWLHARRDEANAELPAALSRCDGEHILAILMVRDDFSMALLRFLKPLGITLKEGTNFAIVDLFDLDHSRAVLLKCGQAFAKLPDALDELNESQKAFLEQAIQGLSEDGLVVPVRLALFAAMVERRPWIAQTLGDVGGTEGIGVTFLEETFGRRSSNPAHRSHEKAARAVLEALLPEDGTTIKGHIRSHQELLSASGYSGAPDEFGDLLVILDAETRLITPTESGESDLMGLRPTTGQYYQLTHDYAVQSVRAWLHKKETETFMARLGAWCRRPERMENARFLGIMSSLCGMALSFLGCIYWRTISYSPPRPTEFLREYILLYSSQAFLFFLSCRFRKDRVLSIALASVILSAWSLYYYVAACSLIPEDFILRDGGWFDDANARTPTHLIGSFGNGLLAALTWIALYGSLKSKRR